MNVNTNTSPGTRNIIIDPGHGGSDPGATFGGLREAFLTLIISQLVFAELHDLASDHNLQVTLTRNSDTFVSLEDRVKIANEIHKKAGYKNTFFFSIHINAGGGSGFESYTAKHSSVVSDIIQTVLHKEIKLFFKAAYLPDRGKKKEDYHVLKKTLCPAVLLENGFIDNTLDMSFVANKSGLLTLSKTIAGGIVKALDAVGGR